MMIRYLKFLAICIVVFIYSSFIILASENHSGDVWGTWTKVNSPHIIIGDVRVPPGMSLIIEAGCEVLFWAHYKFVVDDTAVLIAVGTPTEIIVFDENFPGNGWHGIRLLNASSSSKMSYCHFKHGIATGTGNDGYGGAIFCSNTSPQITFCTFENNHANTYGGAIYCTQSSPLILQNTFNSNFGLGSGGAICCISYSSPDISGNDYTSNNTNGGGRGGAIFCDANSSPAIAGNSFSSNMSGNGGAIYCGANSCSSISGNIFTSNSSVSTNAGGGAISCDTLSSLTISGNTFISNESVGSFLDSGGGAIYCDQSDALISYNIFDKNTSEYGGAICCYKSNSNIFSNTFMTNKGDYFGGAINCHKANPTISNNLFLFNYSYSQGGAIYSENNCNPVITDNIFNSNSSDTGGAISVVYISDSIILNNKFMLNSASTKGGAINVNSSQPNITNNSFYMNTAANGAGIYLWGSEVSTTIINNTLYANSSTLSGAGIFCSASNPTIANTILWSNDAPSFAEIDLFNGSAPTVTYCDVFGGWPGQGNIDSDPLYVDPDNGDLHIYFGSPCKDKGNNSIVTEPFDFESDLRIAYGTVDIGADEFYTHLYITGDKTPGGSIQGKFVGLPGTNPVGLFIGSGILSAPANTMWGEYWLQSPWFLFTLIPIPSNGILELPTTLSGSIPAPYDIPMQALIGLNADSLTNLCVLEVR